MDEQINEILEQKEAEEGVDIIIENQSDHFEEKLLKESICKEEKICDECGTKIPEGFIMCPKCGKKVADKQKGKRKLAIGIIMVALIIAIVGVVTYNNIIVPKQKYDSANTLLEKGEYGLAIDIFNQLGDYKDSESKIIEAENKLELENALKKLDDLKQKLKNAYNDCSASGTSLSSDGMSLSVDSSSKYDYLGLLDIMSIIESLGLPDSLMDEMKATNSLMGMQSETYDNIEVKWSYHPDNGLDAIFKIVK